jgi:hypothetical protein
VFDKRLCVKIKGGRMRLIKVLLSDESQKFVSGSTDHRSYTCVSVENFPVVRLNSVRAFHQYDVREIRSKWADKRQIIPVIPYQTSNKARASIQLISTNKSSTAPLQSALTRQTNYSTCNVTFGQPVLQQRSNRNYMLWLCVCSFWYPECNARAPCCHLWLAKLYNIFIYDMIYI